MERGEYIAFWEGLSKEEREAYISKLRSRKAEVAVYADAIRDLYYSESGQKLGSCISCILRAHYELVSGKTFNKNRIMAKGNQKGEAVFALRPGVVLYDKKNKSAKKIMTAKNCTDELAVYHLATNPASEKYFTKLPSDWKERVAEFVGGGAKPAEGSKAPKEGENEPTAEGEKPAEAEAPAEGEKPSDGEETGKTEESPLSPEEQKRLVDGYNATPKAKTGRPSEQ